MKCNRLQECCDTELIEHLHIECDRAGQCIRCSDCRRIINCVENQRKYQYLNTLGNHVILYHMDGGIIDDNTTAKCDFLLVAGEQSPICILVELKGNDVSYAISQIDATLQVFSDFFNGCSRVYARVIATQVMPNIKATAKVVKLRKKVEKMYGTLEIKSRQFQDKDIELI